MARRDNPQHRGDVIFEDFDRCMAQETRQPVLQDGGRASVLPMHEHRRVPPDRQSRHRRKTGSTATSSTSTSTCVRVARSRTGGASSGRPEPHALSEPRHGKGGIGAGGERQAACGTLAEFYTNFMDGRNKSALSQPLSFLYGRAVSPQIFPSLFPQVPIQCSLQPTIRSSLERSHQLTQLPTTTTSSSASASAPVTPTSTRSPKREHRNPSLQARS